MIVKRTAELPIAAETACGLAQKPAVFRHVIFASLVFRWRQRRWRRLARLLA